MQEALCISIRLGVLGNFFKHRPLGVSGKNGWVGGGSKKCFLGNYQGFQKGKYKSMVYSQWSDKGCRTVFAYTISSPPAHHQTLLLFHKLYIFRYLKYYLLACICTKVCSSLRRCMCLHCISLVHVIYRNYYPRPISCCVTLPLYVILQLLKLLLYIFNWNEKKLKHAID